MDWLTFAPLIRKLTIRKSCFQSEDNLTEKRKEYFVIKTNTTLSMLPYTTNSYYDKAIWKLFFGHAFSTSSKSIRPKKSRTNSFQHPSIHALHVTHRTSNFYIFQMLPRDTFWPKYWDDKQQTSWVTAPCGFVSPPDGFASLLFDQAIP